MTTAQFSAVNEFIEENLEEFAEFLSNREDGNDGMAQAEEISYELNQFAFDNDFCLELSQEGN